jgi:hypothetical protein
MSGAAKTAKKQRGLPFQPGASGNPSGRPAGSRNRVTLAMDELLDGEADALTRKAIDMAKAGDTVAMRLCLDRLAPPRKDRPITFALPKLETAADAKEAVAALIAAVAAGEMTPSEAGDVCRLIDGFAGILKVTDIEARLEALEQGSRPT